MNRWKERRAAGMLCASMLLFSVAANAENERTFSSTLINDSQDSTNVARKMQQQTLGEVVVTTQKRHQSTVEIPTSVSAVTGTLLGQLNLNQMDQMSAYIPGIQIQQQSPNNSSYAIRGVTSDDGSATSQPRVSVFLDGISNFRTQSSQVELFDLDRVEVTKGPQGTLFGRGAEIGAIDIIRKKPTNTLGGEFSINYGTRNQLGVTGVLNTPIVNAKLLNRLAFSYDRHDGFIKNEAGGRLNGKSSLALRNSTRWFLNDNTKLDLVLDYQYDNYPGTSFKSNRFAPENDYSPTPGKFDANAPANLEEGDWLGIKRHIGGGMINLTGKVNDAWTWTSLTGLRGYHSIENFDADGTYLPLLKCDEKAGGFQVSQELRFNYDNRGPLKGFAGLSYFYENVYQGADLNTNPQYLYPAYIQGQIKKTADSYLEKYDQLSTMINGFDFSKIPQIGPILNQFKGQIAQAVAGQKENISKMVDKWFSTPAGQKQEKLPDFYGDADKAVSGLIAGFKAQLASNPLTAPYAQLLDGMGLSQILTLIGADQNKELSKVVNMVKGYSNMNLPESYKENMTNYAENHAIDVFADASYTIVKGFTATLGLRGTYENQHSAYSSTTNNAENPFFALQGSAFLYNPTKNGSKVWASKNYFSWVGRFALNYMFKRNNIYATISRGRRPGVIAFNNNPNDLITMQPEIIWNYEAGIKGYASRHLYYDFAVYYYDWYHFQSNAMVDAPGIGAGKQYKAIDAGRAHSLGFEGTLRYAPCNYFNIFASYAYNNAKFNKTDEDGKEQEYAGNRFRLTPENTFAIGANVTIPTSDIAFIYFNPTYTWKDKMYFEDDNNEELSQKAYGLLNFTLGYHFSPKNVGYDFSLFGRNVLDQKYIVDAGNSGRQIGFPTFVGGTRSIFGAMMKITF